MSDAELLELTELCNALADARLSDEQQQRLNAWLSRSEEARRFYVRFAGLNASLMDYAAELQSEIAEPAPPKPKLIRFPKPVVWWAGIGALAASVAVALLFKPSGSAPTAPTEDTSVAWLTGAKDARWANAAAAPETGDSLERGQRLELQAGVAEVTFDSGARVVLEGPASLDVESAWSAALRSGTATASAPAQAVGFRVANPAVAVTSLGGEVRIEADRTGTAEVVSLEGSAEAMPRGKGERLLLQSKQARRFSAGGVFPVADLEQKLTRPAGFNLERKGRPVRMARWSLDGGNLLLPPGKNRNVNPRTVAFWARIPTDASPGEQPEIAGFETRKSGALRVAWNTSPEQGPLGALRTEHDGQSIVGRTSLRDGQWHHIAVMVLGGRKTGRLEIKQYVDGQLEGTGSIAWRKFEGPGENREFVWFNGIRTPRQELGKVILADRPLTPFELHTLMETDRLPGDV